MLGGMMLLPLCLFLSKYAVLVGAKIKAKYFWIILLYCYEYDILTNKCTISAIPCK